MIIEHNFTQRADRFQVTPGQMRNASVTALSAATNINGDWFVKDEPEGGVLFSYIGQSTHCSKLNGERKNSEFAIASRNTGPMICNVWC